MPRLATIALIAVAMFAGESYARGSSGSGPVRGGRAPRAQAAGRTARAPGRSPFGNLRSRATRPAQSRAMPTQRTQVTRGSRAVAPVSRTRPGGATSTRGSAASRPATRSGLFTPRGGVPRSRGMSTAEYLQRRYRTTGTTANATSGRGARAGGGAARAGGRTGEAFLRGGRHEGAGGRRGNGGATTGYRQPTIGPGYADRFPGTGGPPIKGDCRYYRPCYSPYRRCYYGFYYAWPVAYAYVPFGFYGGGTSVYIDTTGSVSDEYVVQRYEEKAPQPEEDVEMRAAAESAAAERYMREATELFRAKDYPEAARRFRLAAIAAPDSAGPLFALGQALVVLENYPYAAKVIRQAIDLEPALLKESGDLGAVYSDREEFGRVQKVLAKRITDRPDDLHARFLLGVTQYFSGDPAARATFAGLAVSSPNDTIVASLAQAANERFRKADELPPID